MPRPVTCRRVQAHPPVALFLPDAGELRGRVVLTLDELEAMRLADVEGLYQEEAAAQMEVSRTTFARVLAQARAKVASALVGGLGIAIEGGVVCERTTSGCPRVLPEGCPRSGELPARCRSCPRRAR